MTVVTKDIPELSPNDIRRFWSKVEVGDDSCCWPWRAGLKPNGYGSFGAGGRAGLNAHKVAWVIHNQRQVPPGQFVLHTCHQRWCCNPDHLYVGDHGQNMRDRNEAGRTALNIGDRCGTSKLTSLQVVIVRDMYATGDYTQEQLAVLFGVRQSSISRAIRSVNWASVKEGRMKQSMAEAKASGRDLSAGVATREGDVAAGRGEKTTKPRRAA